MIPLRYRHVDVFATRPYGGNSLPVFVDPVVKEADALLSITREVRHFEAVFLWATDNPQRWITRVFDLSGELPFAGHPLIGAAAVLHERSACQDGLEWEFVLSDRSVTTTTRPLEGRRWTADLAQGAPRLGGVWEAGSRTASEVAAAFSLDPVMLREDLPLRVVSTGLRYLVVPVTAPGLAAARIVRDLTELLSSLGAEFAVLVDPNRPEARHWNNDGVVEDVATGSAAGCIAAYLRMHSLNQPGKRTVLHQGRFVGRPSEILIEASGAGENVAEVRVGGTVTAVGSGQLDVLP